jgi:Uma2 family endonuclease
MVASPEKPPTLTIKAAMIEAAMIEAATIEAATIEDPPKVTTITKAPAPIVQWILPPDDFVLDDTPVENTGQPLIAGALKESLEIADRIPANCLIASNFGISATIQQDLTLKAPDWLYVPQVRQVTGDRKSYTPNVEGDLPTIVMEFLSETDGGEYSIRRIPPVGKWFFYEQVLRIPTYVIFDPSSGLLELYRLGSEEYGLEQPDENGQHWFEELKLFLGTWRGEKEGRYGYWLRWWDPEGNMLPWAVEKLAIEQAKAEAAQLQAETSQQQAEAEKTRADRLAALLRAQGIDPDAD